MTVTYKAQGSLTEPVNDLNAAREFLREHTMNIHQYIYPDEAQANVHSITWDLRNQVAWEVTVIADQPLPPAQRERLSEWISGQNSDGIGEGFEQQPFAEHFEEEDPEDGNEGWIMSSFDWETNPCTLEEVR